MVIFKSKEEYLKAANGNGEVDIEMLFEATVLEEMESYTGKKITRIEMSCEDEYITSLSEALEEEWNWDKVTKFESELNFELSDRWGELEWANVYGKSNMSIEPYTVMAFDTNLGGCEAILLVYFD